MSALWNWLMGRRATRTVAEIMQPISDIHEALHTLHVDSESNADAAHNRMMNAAFDKNAALFVSQQAIAAKDKLAALLPA